MKAFIDDIDDDPGDCKGANPPRDTAHPAFIRKTPLQRYKDAKALLAPREEIVKGLKEQLYFYDPRFLPEKKVIRASMCEDGNIALTGYLHPSVVPAFIEWLKGQV